MSHNRHRHCYKIWRVDAAYARLECPHPGCGQCGALGASVATFPLAYTFLMICTMSSSCSWWSLPTRCGRCFTLLPHTSANLKLLIMVLWMRLQKSSTVERLRWHTTGSLKSGSLPEVGKERQHGQAMQKRGRNTHMQCVAKPSRTKP